jgi:hypothetical protein
MIKAHSQIKDFLILGKASQVLMLFILIILLEILPHTILEVMEFIMGTLHQ